MEGLDINFKGLEPLILLNNSLNKNLINVNVKKCHCNSTTISDQQGFPHKFHCWGTIARERKIHFLMINSLTILGKFTQQTHEITLIF